MIYFALLCGVLLDRAGMITRNFKPELQKPDRATQEILSNIDTSSLTRSLKESFQPGGHGMASIPLVSEHFPLKVKVPSWSNTDYHVWRSFRTQYANANGEMTSFLRSEH